MAMRIVSSTIRQYNKVSSKSYKTLSSSIISTTSSLPVSTSVVSSIPSTLTASSSKNYSTIVQSNTSLSSSSSSYNNSNNHESFNNHTLRQGITIGLATLATTYYMYTNQETTTHAESNGEMILFSGNANPELAAEIATLIGSSLGNITVARFADGEVNVQVSI